MMTRNRWLVVAAGLALAGVAACNNDKITNLNKNPNSPEDVPAGPLFTTATRQLVGLFLGSGYYDLRGPEFITQHLAEVQYPDEDRYARLTGGSTTGFFDSPYENGLEDLQKAFNKGKASNSAGTWAPAQVMKTWGFDYVTDVWGDIPYFKALAGDSGVVNPPYDAQQSIYADFFKVLSEDATALTGASNDLGNADPIYQGDPKLWQKFANSLHARLALRTVNVDPALADKELTAAFSAPGGLISSNAENAQLNWPGDGIYNNPWADNFSGRDDHRMSQTLMNIMLASNDPRIPIYAQPTVADPAKYAGMPNGLTQDQAQAYFNTSSRPGAVFYPGQTVYGFFGGSGKSWPSFLLTYAEVEFIKAEAAGRGIGGLSLAQAQGFYNEGIRASMEQWGVTDAGAVASFLANPNVAYPAGGSLAAQLSAIDLQRWIALYTDGTQAWALWRRTCVPNTVRPGPEAIVDSVPRRYQYSITEYSVNSANLNAAISRQGPDEFLTRMWWDKSPQASPTYTAGCGAKP